MTNASCHDMEIAVLVIHARLVNFYAFFLNLAKVAGNH